MPAVLKPWALAQGVGSFSQLVGKPFAIIPFMILALIRMKVLPEKHMELSQTIVSLMGSIRTEKGCNRCDFCQSMENENQLFFLEEWDTQENLKRHLKSGRFKVLREAMNLLREPYQMSSTPFFIRRGWRRFNG
jgi:quinol monooxygenase YgiN